VAGTQHRAAAQLAARPLRHADAKEHVRTHAHVRVCILSLRVAASSSPGEVLDWHSCVHLRAPAKYLPAHSWVHLRAPAKYLPAHSCVPLRAPAMQVSSVKLELEEEVLTPENVEMLKEKGYKVG